jgi:Zn-dependent protease with chaperone function
VSRTVKGRYFDGRTAVARPLELAIDDSGRVHTVPEGIEPPVSIRDLRVSSRIGNVPRALTFPSGGSFETSEHDTVDAWLQGHGARRSFAHALESRWRYALGALVVVAAFVVVTATWGIPWVSGLIAPAIPQRIANEIGAGTLDYLDQLVFEESELSAARASELRALFERLVPAGTDTPFRLEFRTGGAIEANAFALPNGVVVATDELIELAANDEEIASVLLHEIGHVVHRHGLRQLINYSGLATLMLLVFGDVNAAGSIVVAMPNVLLASSYSRTLEREADDYALMKMRELGIPTVRFADFMERMEAFYRCERPKDDDAVIACRDDPDAAAESDEPTWFHYVSTHPATSERIARFRDGN